jgi:transposase
MDDASSIPSLPDDPAALKEIIATLRHERDEASRRRDEAQHQYDEQTRQRDEARRCIEQLESRAQQLEIEKQAIELKALRFEVELLRLRKLYYGPRADRLSTVGDVAQMLLDFAVDLERRPVNAQDVPPDTSGPEVQTIRRVRRGRRDLAALAILPVVRREHDLPENQKPCPCCGGMREKIGEESSWQVEFIPGHFERIEHVRIKYACKHCEQSAESPQIQLADKPAQPIEKGMAGPGLLAYVITSKYADYLPLYRLQNIFGRNGFEIDRATPTVWCGDVADLVRPLYQVMVQSVLQSHVICTDDTVMPMLAPEKTSKARMWVYVGDEHHPYNVFDFTLGRGRDGPAKFLGNYKQTLLADAYGGYDGIVVGNDILRAGCWAHARRKFVDVEKLHPAIAAEAVGIIRQLYIVEDRGKSGTGRGGEMDVGQRLALRQSESVPILSKLKDRLLAWRDQLLPKHPMAEAVHSALNQWNELNVFAGDSAVPIDNNVSEREMKRIVLNRKNSLFVGNQRGGVTAAILSSITSTCRRHGIDPQRYITQLLTNLPTTPISHLADRLPDRWKQSQLPPAG